MAGLDAFVSSVVNMIMIAGLQAFMENSRVTDVYRMVLLTCLDLSVPAIANGSVSLDDLKMFLASQPVAHNSNLIINIKAYSFNTVSCKVPAARYATL